MGRGTRAHRQALRRAASAVVLAALAGCGSTGSSTVISRPATTSGSATATSSGGATATSSTPGQTNITTQPLPMPAGSDVIAAGSRASFFGQHAFAGALSNLTALLGPKASITNMAIYPGEIDLVLDQDNGDLRRIRVDHTGAVHEDPHTYPVSRGPTAIYLDQIPAGVAHLLAADTASLQGVPIGHVTAVVLVTDLPGENAGWDISVLPHRGTAPVTYRAFVSGSGLRKL